MTGELITLPLRLSIRGAKITLRGLQEVAGRSFALAGFVARTLGSDEAGTESASSGAAAEAASRRAATEAPSRRAATESASNGAATEAPSNGAGTDAPTRRIERREPSPPAPAEHVSTEPELVAEVAEPGAEDGAGAEVTVAEPWPGYRAMTAEDVIARLDQATAAEAGAVKLFESFHQNRTTVIAAAERRL